MSNSQLYLVIGLPTISVLVGILVNLVQTTGLRSDINVLRGEVRSGISILTGKVIELVDRVSRLEAHTER